MNLWCNNKIRSQHRKRSVDMFCISVLSCRQPARPLPSDLCGLCGCTTTLHFFLCCSDWTAVINPAAVRGLRHLNINTCCTGPIYWKGDPADFSWEDRFCNTSVFIQYKHVETETWWMWFMMMCRLPKHLVVVGDKWWSRLDTEKKPQIAKLYIHLTKTTVFP